MRIIAGSLSGHTIISPKGWRTHPMSEKVRGALFNSLGDLSGLSVLDAFAGSGALSFEAVSRGAEAVTAIDNDRRAQIAIAENIHKFKLENRVKLIKATASAWLKTSDKTFDIVLMDAPFNDLQLKLQARLAERTKPGGLVVVSLPKNMNILLPASFSLLHQKDYGDSSLYFYRVAAG